MIEMYVPQRGIVVVRDRAVETRLSASGSSSLHSATSSRLAPPPGTQPSELEFIHGRGLTVDIAAEEVIQLLSDLGETERIQEINSRAARKVSSDALRGLWS